MQQLKNILAYGLIEENNSVVQSVAKSARQFGHTMQIFLCLQTIKGSISEEMNNDNNLNLHSMTKLSGWLCYCVQSIKKIYLFTTGI